MTYRVITLNKLWKLMLTIAAKAELYLASVDYKHIKETKIPS